MTADMREDNIDASILSDPRRVFNLCELVFYLRPSEKCEIAVKGTRNLHNVIEQWLVVILGGNASGECPPALILHRYDRVPKQFSSNIPESIELNYSPTGCMTARTFYEYVSRPFFNWIKKRNIQMPIALFVNGHSSHITLSLCEFCKENGIILIALLANSTHVTQPMEVGIIPPLKSLWRKHCELWEKKNSKNTLQNHHFAPLLGTVFDELKQNAALFSNAFRKCGM